jgi:hypothetical protein
VTDAMAVQYTVGHLLAGSKRRLHLRLLGQMASSLARLLAMRSRSKTRTSGLGERTLSARAVICLISLRVKPRCLEARMKPSRSTSELSNRRQPFRASDRGKSDRYGH